MQVGDRRSLVAAVVGVVELVALGITSWLAMATAFDARAYARAPECTTGAGGGDCLREASGVVLGVSEHGGKSATWRAL